MAAYQEGGASLLQVLDASRTLAAAMAEWVGQAADATGIRRVALSGGCFLNRVLTEALTVAFEQRGIEPLRPVRLKPGDSAVSVGQAWAVAMARR